MIKQKVGFTLAEVLITLGVIGVVAAITLPVLIKNHEKTVLVNKLKTAFSTLDNLTHKIMADDDVFSFDDTLMYKTIVPKPVDGEWYGLNKSHLEALGFDKYIKYSVYECGTNDSKCKYNYLTRSGDAYAARVIQLPNGLNLYSFSFIYRDYSNNTSTFPNKFCGYAQIDVNGYHIPNKVGRDVFYLWMTCDGNWHAQYDKTYARLQGNDTYWPNVGNSLKCDPSLNTSGEACAARIIAEGWKMNY